MIVFLSTCNRTQPYSQQDLKADSLAQVTAEWKEWAEETDEGLWEGDSTHFLSFELLSVYGGDICQEPLFYQIESFDVSGDTIFISDQQTQQLVAIDFNGNLLWKVGGSGEGPGLFSRIAQLDVNNQYIAVANMGNGRIDLFSKAGKWLESIPVLGSFDISFIDDTTLAVVSYQVSGGIVHLFNIGGAKVSSFGNGEAFPSSVLGGGNRDLHCALFGSDILSVNSYFANHNELYNVKEENMIFQFERVLPLEIPENRIGNGAFLTTFLLDVFEGPEGMINIPLRPISLERTCETDNENWANVTVIDRFNLECNYLDSYIIPTICDQMIFHNGELFVSNWIECSIYRYRVIYNTD